MSEQLIRLDFDTALRKPPREDGNHPALVAFSRQLYDNIREGRIDVFAYAPSLAQGRLNWVEGGKTLETQDRVWPLIRGSNMRVKLKDVLELLGGMADGADLAAQGRMCQELDALRGVFQEEASHDIRLDLDAYEGHSDWIKLMPKEAASLPVLGQGAAPPPAQPATPTATPASKAFATRNALKNAGRTR